MGRTVLSIVGILLAVWLAFMVIGWIVSTLKFLFFVGLIALVAMFVVVVIGRLARSK
jgi:hypothetical protein